MNVLSSGRDGIFADVLPTHKQISIQFIVERRVRFIDDFQNRTILGERDMELVDRREIGSTW